MQPAVADAEQHGAAVALGLREPTRIAGAARHHVAIERAREINGLAVVQPNAEQPAWPTGAPDQPTTSSAEPSGAQVT